MYSRSLSSTHSNQNQAAELIILHPSEHRQLQLSQSHSVDIENLYSEPSTLLNWPVFTRRFRVRQNLTSIIEPAFFEQNQFFTSNSSQSQNESQQYSEIFQEISEMYVEPQSSIRNRNSLNHHFLIRASSSHSQHSILDDFQDRLELLLRDIEEPRPKHKFRHYINRINTKCSICFEKIKKGQTICRTRCRHKFHTECLEKWTQRNPSCPLCRKKFNKNN